MDMEKQETDWEHQLITKGCHVGSRLSLLVIFISRFHATASVVPVLNVRDIKPQNSSF
jgi:hypothetical protein